MRRILIPAVILLLGVTAGCSSGPQGPGGTAGDGSSPASCASLKKVQLASWYGEFPGPKATDVELATLSLPPGVTPSKADCAWMFSVPAGTTDTGSGATTDGTLWFATGFYRDLKANPFTKLKPELTAAGCTDRDQDGESEWICNAPDPNPNAAGWVITYSDGPVALDGSDGAAWELDITYQESDLGQ